MAGDSVTETAGNALLDWVCDQLRMRNIVARPFGIFDGAIAGELLYHDPQGARPPVDAPRGS